MVLFLAASREVKDPFALKSIHNELSTGIFQRGQSKIVEGKLDENAPNNALRDCDPFTLTEITRCATVHIHFICTETMLGRVVHMCTQSVHVGVDALK